MRFRRFLTLSAGEDFCNILRLGGTDRRKGPASMPRTFLSHHLPLTFTGPIRTNWPLVLVEYPGVGCLIASGGGAVMNPASVVPPDRHQRSPSPEY